MVVTGLLHECGHVLVGRTIERSCRYHTRYKRGYSSDNVKTSRSNVSAADLVHEEIEAWHRGRALARRLRVRVDESVYWRDYGACIKVYLKKMARREI